MKTTLFISIFFLIVIFAIGKPKTILNNALNSIFLTFLLLVYVSIGIFRLGVPDPCVDAPLYLRFFNLIRGYSLNNVLTISNYDPLFTLQSWVLARIFNNTYLIWFSFFVISSLLLIIGLINIFNTWQLSLVYFTYVNYVFYYSTHLHVIRQGMAIAILVLAIAGILKKNNYLFYPCIFTAPLFHLSALPFALILFFIKKTIISIKHSLLIWCALSILFLTNLNKNVFSFIPHNKILKYSSLDIILRYGKTNRLDFYLFSLIFIIYCLIFLIYVKVRDNAFTIISNIYILFNAVFLMFGFIAYSDRIALYSWYIIPIIIWYPLLNLINQNYDYNPLFSELLIINSALMGIFINPFRLILI